MSGRRPKPVRDAAICRRYAGGEKLSAIARDYGMSTARVVQIAQEGGLPSRNVQRRRFSPPPCDNCVLLPLEGRIRLVSVPSACRPGAPSGEGL